MIDTYEREITMPSLDKTIAIAEHFHVTVEELVNIDLSNTEHLELNKRNSDLQAELEQIKSNVATKSESEVMQMKDEMIEMLKRQVKDLQDFVDQQKQIISDLKAR